MVLPCRRGLFLFFAFMFISLMEAFSLSFSLFFVLCVFFFAVLFLCILDLLHRGGPRVGTFVLFLPECGSNSHQPLFKFYCIKCLLWNS